MDAEANKGEGAGVKAGGFETGVGLGVGALLVRVELALECRTGERVERILDPEPAEPLPLRGVPTQSSR